jgi:hypothetical protein
MLVAAAVVTPIGGWAAAPALLDPVALAAGTGVGIASSVIPYVADQLAMAKLERATYALMVSLFGDRDRHRHRRLARSPQVEVAGVARRRRGCSSP